MPTWSGGTPPGYACPQQATYRAAAGQFVRPRHGEIVTGAADAQVKALEEKNKTAMWPRPMSVALKPELLVSPRPRAPACGWPGSISRPPS